MSMKVATFNDCKVYNLSAGKTMPQWLSDSKKRSLLNDDEYRKRLELIQDFEMTVASQCIKMTNDGEHIIVTGTYPPVIRCYTVSDLAMKFQRGLSCEVVAFETLSDDFGKLVFLQSDRTVNFHAPYGTHYSLRVPKFGRDICYNWNNCDLCVGASGNEIYRINLETGQFREPFELGFSGCNKLHINPMHNLLGCGGDNAICEFWDPRSRKSVAKLQVDPSKSVDITALKFDSDGLTLGVGTSNGNCHVYDIRSMKPQYTKEHQYGLPIINIAFHSSGTSKHIISTDKKLLKIWERNEPALGKILTNIETPANINDVLVINGKKGHSGLIMMATEQTRVLTYFVPNLGHAPKWCSFLESLTEELEESGSQNVYEDYKFITQKEVEDLGATALIGTPMLKGYMHGYFMEMKLYNKLRAVSKPFEYDEYRLAKIKDKINEKRASRITPRKRLSKVNQQLAQKLLTTSSSSNKKNKTNDDSNPNALVDDRFAALFQREEFQQDSTSSEYLLRNPTAAGRGRDGGKKQYDNDDEDDDLYRNDEDNGNDNGVDIDDDEEEKDNDDNDENDGDDDGYDDDDDEENEMTHSQKRSKGQKRGHKSSNGVKETPDDEEDGQIMRATKRSVVKNQKQKLLQQRKKVSSNSGPVMMEMSSGLSSSKIIFENHHRKSRRGGGEDDVPLSTRLGNGGSRDASGHHGRDGNLRGSIKTIHTEKEGTMREISFMPKSDSKMSRHGSSDRSSSSREEKAGKGSRLDRERAHFIA